jgi:hypothetical protein
MHLIPTSNPNETISVENAPGRMVELRIGIELSPSFWALFRERCRPELLL